MDFSTYQHLFQTILEQTDPPAPYNRPEYLNYTKLNWSRQQRWLKVGVLDSSLEEKIRAISEERFWIIITEPWCGDAAHIVPFLHKLADLNPLIQVDYVQRDSPPFLIGDYLTEGTKSIPKLIIRDKAGKDLAVWGPRPAPCQLLFKQLKAQKADFETTKIALQKWYNEDHGRTLQAELTGLI